jgi:hypothetical protein
VGFVCEGPTDVEVFEPLIAHVTGRVVKPVYLQPTLDRVDAPGGDTRVEAWCKRSGFGLEWMLKPRGIELLIVQLDADRCPKYGAADTHALCSTIKGWLGPGAQRSELLIVLPSQATEAWLVAAHQPSTPALEDLRHPENALANLGLLDRRGADGTPQKAPTRYGPMTATLIENLDVVEPVLPELKRFLKKLRAHPALKTPEAA